MLPVWPAATGEMRKWGIHFWLRGRIPGSCALLSLIPIRKWEVGSRNTRQPQRQRVIPNLLRHVKITMGLLCPDVPTAARRVPPFLHFAAFSPPLGVRGSAATFPNFTPGRTRLSSLHPPRPGQCPNFQLRLGRLATGQNFQFLPSGFVAPCPPSSCPPVPKGQGQPTCASRPFASSNRHT